MSFSCLYSQVFKFQRLWLLNTILHAYACILRVSYFSCTPPRAAPPCEESFICFSLNYQYINIRLRCFSFFSFVFRHATSHNLRKVTFFIYWVRQQILFKYVWSVKVVQFIIMASSVGNLYQKFSSAYKIANQPLSGRELQSEVKEDWKAAKLQWWSTDVWRVHRAKISNFLEF